MLAGLLCALLLALLSLSGAPQEAAEGERAVMWAVGFSQGALKALIGPGTSL
jgi:hypothetical protein